MLFSGIFSHLDQKANPSQLLIALRNGIRDFPLQVSRYKIHTTCIVHYILLCGRSDLNCTLA